MFNYKIRQKKSIFSKLQTLTPPLITSPDPTYPTMQGGNSPGNRLWVTGHRIDNADRTIVKNL